jgi:uncharacterized membrane protein YozB (DUF420 family)
MIIYTITTVFSLVGVIYLLRRGEMSPRTGFIVITVALALFFFVLACAWKAGH